MSDNNIYDIHSVYLKSNERGSENWERIEGVNDAEARLNSEKIVSHLKNTNSEPRLKLSIEKSTSLIPGAVRRIVKLFK